MDLISEVYHMQAFVIIISTFGDYNCHDENLFKVPHWNFLLGPQDLLLSRHAVLQTRAHFCPCYMLRQIYRCCKMQMFEINLSVIKKYLFSGKSDTSICLCGDITGGICSMCGSQSWTVTVPDARSAILIILAVWLYNLNAARACVFVCVIWHTWYNVESCLFCHTMCPLIWIITLSS